MLYFILFFFFKQKTAYEMLRILFKQKTAYEMLRSLVGSEMCIRDRHGNRQRNTNKSRCLYTRHRPRSCLLYTSDAADDLTRVDLGGRRIIKKKKKKKTKKKKTNNI